MVRGALAVGEVSVCTTLFVLKLGPSLSLAVICGSALAVALADGVAAGVLAGTLVVAADDGYVTGGSGQSGVVAVAVCCVP